MTSIRRGTPALPHSHASQHHAGATVPEAHPRPQGGGDPSPMASTAAIKNGHLLQGVHPRLVSVIKAAKEDLLRQKSGFDFFVLEGARDPERQKKLVAGGKSQTQNSRHIPQCEYAHAVDLAVTVGGKLSWDFKQYVYLSEIVKRAAAKLGVRDLIWGGDWKTFKDGPHFQIDPKNHGCRKP